LTEKVVLSAAWGSYDEMVRPLRIFAYEFMQRGYAIGTARMAVRIDHYEPMTRYGWERIWPAFPPLPDSVRVSGRVRLPASDAWWFTPTVRLQHRLGRKDGHAGTSQPECRNQILVE
jgi:hypothetical protein